MHLSRYASMASLEWWLMILHFTSSRSASSFDLEEKRNGCHPTQRDTHTRENAPGNEPQASPIRCARAPPTSGFAAGVVVARQMKPDFEQFLRALEESHILHGDGGVLPLPGLVLRHVRRALLAVLGGFHEPASIPGSAVVSRPRPQYGRGSGNIVYNELF